MLIVNEIFIILSFLVGYIKDYIPNIRAGLLFNAFSFIDDHLRKIYEVLLGIIIKNKQES